LVIEQRRLAGAMRIFLVELVGDDGGHALVGECADFDSAGRDRLGARWVDAAIEPQDSEAGTESLLGVWPMGEHGHDEPFGVRPDLAGPAPEAFWRPFGVASVCARHVIGIGAMPRAAPAALMSSNALAAMEQLDCSSRDAHIDLSANERVRHRVIKAIDLDVIIEADARETPFSKFPVGVRQGLERRALNMDSITLRN
jgi:hypothetical protein